MTPQEEVLLWLLNKLADQNTQALLLQSYIAEQGPLSEIAGAKVRELLVKKSEALTRR